MRMVVNFSVTDPRSCQTRRGNRPLSCAAFLALLLLAPLHSLAADTARTNAPTRQDFSSFRLINDRNIFSPRRYARRDRRDSRPATRIESFALVGTMTYEKGTFAFFESSRSDYRKVAKRDDTIAGYNVKEIAPASVKLVAGTNEVQLSVGMQMRREDQGEWQVTAITESSSPSTTTYASRSSSASTATVPQNTSAPSPGTNSEPQVIVFDGTTVVDAGPDAAATNAPPDSTAAGTTDPVLLRLMQRAAAERGDSR